MPNNFSGLSDIIDEIYYQIFRPLIERAKQEQRKKVKIN